MLLLLAALSLQGAVSEAMRGIEGVALVADVASGRLLAQHGGARAKTRRAAPGSTLKPFTLAALIEQGAAGEKTACQGRLRIGERRLDCGHPKLATPVDAESAVAYSCNEYFASAGRRLEPARFAERLRGWGFEASPAASDQERALQAIGEYGVRVTPAGLLEAYRRLTRLAGDSRYAPVFRGMEGAVKYGSAQLAATPGIEVAGKTGTTPNAARTTTHAWFAGFAPARKPEVVVVVFLEQGRGGPSAAPIAARLLAAWQSSARFSKSPLASQWHDEQTPGASSVTVGARGGRTVSLPVEDYVKAVLAGEASTFPEEALKAMAIAARTWAAANRGRHKAQGWDFCDTSHCQNLRLDGSSARIAAAVEATEDQLLWYGGKPAQTFYHRHCGGVTEAAHAVWPQLRVPYLRQQADTYCLTAGKAPWRVEAARRRIEVVGRSPSGRVARLRVDGRVVSYEVIAAELRLVSAWFDVRQQGDRVAFEGYGAGHGVGMCQGGAVERAKAGHTSRQILAFYYPGTKLGLAAQGLTWERRGGERIELWTTRSAQDAPVLELAERLLRDAESRAGRHYNGRARLRVYPSVAVFRDATGEPGWVAASTRGATVRLQPAAELRARGVLESTLLHEFLHLVLEQRAHARLPEWFSEGLVLWLADPGKPPSAGAVLEGDLEHATSEAALRRAYEAARSQVKQLAERYGRASVLTWVEGGLPAEINAASVSQHPTSRK